MRLTRILGENSWSIDCVVETLKGERLGKILKHSKPSDDRLVKTLVVHYGTLRSKPLLVVPTALSIFEDGRICLIYDFDPNTLTPISVPNFEPPRPVAQLCGLLSLLKTLAIDTTSDFAFVDLGNILDIGSLLYFFVPPPLQIFSEKLLPELEFHAEDGKNVVFGALASSEIPTSVVVVATLISRLLENRKVASHVEVPDQVLRYLQALSISGNGALLDRNGLRNDILRLNVREDHGTFRIDFAERGSADLNLELKQKLREKLKNLDNGIVGLIVGESGENVLQIEELIEYLMMEESIKFDAVIYGQTLEEVLSKYLLATNSFDLMSTFERKGADFSLPEWLEISEEIEKTGYRIARRILQRTEKILFLSEDFEGLDFSLKGFYDELLNMSKRLRAQGVTNTGKCVALVTSTGARNDFSEVIEIGDKKAGEDRDVRAEQLDFEQIFKSIDEMTRETLARLANLGPSFTPTEIILLGESLRRNGNERIVGIDLAGTVETGLVTFGLSDLKFVKRTFWKTVYTSELAKTLRENLAKIESLFQHQTFLAKAGVLEDDPALASLKLLRFVRKRLLKCNQVLMLKRIVKEVGLYLQGRESYAYLWALVNLGCVTSEPELVTKVEPPSRKLYKTLRVKRFLLLGDARAALEELEKWGTRESLERRGFGKPLPYSVLQDRFLEALALSYLKELDSGLISSLRRVAPSIKEKNELQVQLKVNLAYFLARNSRDPSDRIRNLKLAEQLSLKYGFLCKLPEIYNSLSISVGALSLKLSYLKKAARYAEEGWLPSKGLDAKANLSLHALSVGDIDVFEKNVHELLFDSQVLGVVDKTEYANFLLALYYAYNCDHERAKKFLDELERKETDFSAFDKLCVLLVLRKFDEAKRVIGEIPTSVREAYERFLQMVESIGTPVFPERWLDFSASPERYYREEILSIFGFELARYLPFKVREELELLQKNYFSNGEILPQALVDEAWGHYYKALEKPINAAWYYERAIKKLNRIGLSGAAQRIERENKQLLSLLNPAQTNESYNELGQKGEETTVWFVEEITDLLSSLNPFVELSTYLQYLLLRAEKFFSIECEIRLRDNFLNEEWTVSSGFHQIETERTEDHEIGIRTIHFRIDENSHVEFRFLSEGKNAIDATISLDEQLVFKFGTQALLKNALRMFRSTRDPLTKLYNRYYLEESLHYFFNSARRLGRNFVLILGDLDNFKDVNDTYGHLAGDEVLRKVAKVLRLNVRSSDIVARYGGDEFAIIVPDISLEEGFSIAERLRHEVSVVDSPIPINVSFGVVKMDNTTRYPTELLELADRALYMAKNSGKNATVILES